jgi:RNA polymerase sigma-70 factor (ECF subfamily)
MHDSRVAPMGMIPAVHDDAALVEEAQANSEAFALLYERYRDRVYWYLRTRTGNPEDAADLLQQVFLQAFAGLPRYRPRKGPFVGWLFAIARNTAINFHNRRRSTVAWDLVPEALRPNELGPEISVMHREDLARLQTVFDALDPDKRELLVLRFVVGLTAREIAVAIGAGEAATKKRLTRTLTMLKEQYHDNPY